MLHRSTQDSFGLTHMGKVRSVNQDQFLIASMPASFSWPTASVAVSPAKGPAVSP